MGGGGELLLEMQLNLSLNLSFLSKFMLWSLISCFYFDLILIKISIISQFLIKFLINITGLIEE